MKTTSKKLLGLSGLMGVLVLPLSLASAQERPDCRTCTDEFNACRESAEQNLAACVMGGGDLEACWPDFAEAAQGCNDSLSGCQSDCTY